MEYWVQVGSGIQSARRVHIRSWTDFLLVMGMAVLYVGMQYAAKRLFPNVPQGAIQIGIIVILFIMAWIYMFICC